MSNFLYRTWKRQRLSSSCTPVLRLAPLRACLTLEERKKSKKGFTLIEMLVVIAIIGLLASLIVPAVNSAIGRAKMTGSLSNLRQMFTGFGAYQLDNKNTWPAPRPSTPPNRWVNEILGYMTPGDGVAADDDILRSVFISPGWNQGEIRDRYPNLSNAFWRKGYAMNVMLPDDLEPVSGRYVDGATMKKYPMRIRKPAQTILVADYLNAFLIPHTGNSSNYDLVSTRYNGKITALYCDGHVEAILWDDSARELFRHHAGSDQRPFWIGDL